MSPLSGIVKDIIERCWNMKLNGQGCYRIKKWVFWVMVLLFITLITMAGQKEKIREKWLHSQKRVEISLREKSPN